MTALVGLLAAAFWPGVAGFVVVALREAGQKWLAQNAVTVAHMAELKALATRVQDLTDKVNSNSSFKAFSGKPTRP